MISDRLLAIANEVKQNDIVCDIGTDHAFLPIFLIKSNIAKKVYAVDINIEPLNQAKKNIKKHNISDDNIELILSEGLKWKDKNLQIDNCIISGLGGTTIKNILLDDDINIKKYILCPNNNEIIIREWIKSKHFFIEKEILISDNNIFYLIIIVNKFIGFKIKNYKDILFGPYLRRNKTDNYYQFWILKYKHINNYFNNINNKNKKYKKIKYEIKLIKKQLNKRK